MPPLLRWWYQVRSPGCDSSVNRLLDPRELRVVDERVVFYVAADFAWCCDREGQDPSVWGAPRPDRGEAWDWQREGERLSGFLFQVLLFETLCAAPVGARGRLLPEEVDLVRARLPALPLAPWRWPRPGSTLHGSPRCAAFIAGEEVVIGAREAKDLDWLEGLPAERWQGASFLKRG